MTVDLISPDQERFLDWAHFLNTPARAALGVFERIAYLPPHARTSLGRLAEKIKNIALMSMLSTTALFGFCFSTPLYILASLLGKGRIKIVPSTRPLQGEPPSEIRISDWNVAFQDPYSVFTAGVRRPLEKNSQGIDRVEEVARQILQENPDVAVFQECEARDAQKRFAKILSENGYNVVYDAGNHPFFNPSGSLIAIKRPIEKIEFAAFPWKNREGLAKGSCQGALGLTISVKNLRGEIVPFKVIGYHGCYGGEENQPARERQLGENMAPLLGDRSIVVGDMNFSTKEHPLSSIKGFESYTNAVPEDRVTCSNEAKLARQGRAGPIEKECIDGVLHRENIQVSDLSVENLPTLSDHCLIKFTAQVR